MNIQKYKKEKDYRIKHVSIRVNGKELSWMKENSVSPTKVFRNTLKKLMKRKE